MSFLKRIFSFFSFLVFFSCASGYKNHLAEYTFHSNNDLPDYSNLNYWAANPFKKNLSDSLPKKLKSHFQKDTSIDVFFIYPTTYADKSFSLGTTAPIDNADINAKTDYSTILYQASIFNEARIFSPRYRQANYWCYFPKTHDDTIRAVTAFQLAYEDVKTAFEYYLKHYNNGRPIIIASHSQGTTHAKTLLKEFFDGKPLQQKLIAAFLVGMPIETNYFTNIKPCDSASQTGCVCSWRTFRKDYIAPYAQNEKFKTIVTNPLTWNKNDSSAPREKNEGSVLVNFKRIVPRTTNAFIHGNVLWVDKPKFFGNVFFNTKNYHIADYNLFYMNVRENVEERIKAYKSLNP